MSRTAGTIMFFLLDLSWWVKCLGKDERGEEGKEGSLDDRSTLYPFLLSIGERNHDEVVAHKPAHGGTPSPNPFISIPRRVGITLPRPTLSELRAQSHAATVSIASSTVVGQYRGFGANRANRILMMCGRSDRAVVGVDGGRCLGCVISSGRMKPGIRPSRALQPLSSRKSLPGQASSVSTREPLKLRMHLL